MKITIDPITRISGFLEIRAEAEDNTIVSAKAKGLLFRGFETMLKGRSPFDAIYFNERICGICSAAHSYASALAVENALGIAVPENDRMLRDIIHGFEYIQNHLRQFYLFAVPDYVKIPGITIADNPDNKDYRLTGGLTKQIGEHYTSAIKLSMLAHEGQAVLGGKAPHNHGIFVGGVSTSIDAYKLEKVKSVIRQLLDFVSNAMTKDVAVIAEYYPDYFEKGISYPNFMSYGAFNYEDAAISYVKPGILMDNTFYELNPDLITEQIKYSWFQPDMENNQVDLSKADAYTFIKAPRYAGYPMEVGPLARQLISGEYKGGHSCMDRNIARVRETEKVLNIMQSLADKVLLAANAEGRYEIPKTAFGMGLIDTTRGSLGDWIQIDHQVIQYYNIVTPSMWNLSPKDEAGNPGVIEKALIGTVLENAEEPVEIGRIVRSFDPCVSCATHFIYNGNQEKIIEM